MNRTMKMMVSGMVAVIGAVVIGCNITPEAMKVIAQNAGLGAAVTWIAYDNPSVAEKDLVKTVLGLVKSNSTNVQSGTTYSEALYPLVVTYLDKNTVPSQYKPLVLAGSYAALNGIDTLFAMHPEYKSNTVMAVSIVNCFVDGANAGLSMSEKDPVIVQAKKMNVARVRIYQTK